VPLEHAVEKSNKGQIFEIIRKEYSYIVWLACTAVSCI